MIGVSVLLPVADRVATRPLTGPRAVSGCCKSFGAASTGALVGLATGLVAATLDADLFCDVSFLCAVFFLLGCSGFFFTTTVTSGKATCGRAVCCAGCTKAGVERVFGFQREPEAAAQLARTR